MTVGCKHTNDEQVYVCVFKVLNCGSPNQVLTHAARAAAKQLNKAPLVAARGARRALVTVKLLY